MTSLRFDEQTHEMIERRRLEYEWRQRVRRHRSVIRMRRVLIGLGLLVLADLLWRMFA